MSYGIMASSNSGSQNFLGSIGPLFAGLLRKIGTSQEWTQSDTVIVRHICQNLLTILNAIDNDINPRKTQIIEKSPTIQENALLCCIPLIRLFCHLIQNYGNVPTAQTSVVESLLFLTEVLTLILQRIGFRIGTISIGYWDDNAFLIEPLPLVNIPVPQQKPLLENLISCADSLTPAMIIAISIKHRHGLNAFIGFSQLLVQVVSNEFSNSVQQTHAQILFDLLNVAITLVQSSNFPQTETSSSPQVDSNLFKPSLLLLKTLIYSLASPTLKFLIQTEQQLNTLEQLSSLSSILSEEAMRTRSLLILRYPGLIVMLSTLISKGLLGRLNRMSLEADVLEMLEFLVLCIVPDGLVKSKPQFVSPESKNLEQNVTSYSSLRESQNIDLISREKTASHIAAVFESINSTVLTKRFRYSSSLKQQRQISPSMPSDSPTSSNHSTSLTKKQRKSLESCYLSARISVDYILCRFSLSILQFCFVSIVNPIDVPYYLGRPPDSSPNTVSSTTSSTDHNTPMEPSTLDVPIPTPHVPIPSNHNLFNILLDTLVSSYYALISSFPSCILQPLSNALHRLLEKLTIFIQIKQRLFQLIESIDPYKFAASLHSENHSYTFLTRILGFLYLCFPTNSSHHQSTHLLSFNPGSTVTMLLHRLLPLFHMDWITIRLDLTAFSTTCLDQLGLWVGQIPQNDVNNVFESRIHNSTLPYSAQVLLTLLDPQQVQQPSDSHSYCAGVNSQELFIEESKGFIEVNQCLEKALILPCGDQSVILLISEISECLAFGIPITTILQSLSDIWDTAFTKSSTLYNNNWIHTFNISDNFDSTHFISIATLQNSLGILYLSCQVLTKLNLRLQQETNPNNDITNNLQIISDFIHRLITPITYGGLWNTSSVTLSKNLKTQLNEKWKKSQKPTTSIEIISIINLWDLVILKLLISVIELLNQLMKKQTTKKQQLFNEQYNGERINTILDYEDTTIKFLIGRLETFGYQVLSKIGSVYRLVSFAGLKLLDQIASIVMIGDNNHIHPSSYFIRHYSSAIIDSLTFEITMMKQGMMKQGMCQSMDDDDDQYGIGNILLAAILCCDDDTILSMTDVIELINQVATFQRYSQTLMPVPSIQSNDIAVGYQFPVWAMKAQAAISKRMVNIFIKGDLIDPDLIKMKNEKENVLDDFKDIDEQRALETIADLFINIKKKQINQSTLIEVSNSNTIQSNASLTNIRRLSSISNQKSKKLPESFLRILDVLIDSSQLCFLHSNNQIQYYSHLTCLRALYCASAKRSHLLPKIHQVWPSILISLDHPSITSITLLASLIIRQIIRLTSDFVASRFRTDLFPILCRLLKSHAPATQKDQQNRTELYKVQLILMDIICAAAQDRTLIHPLVGKTCGIVLNFLDVQSCSDCQSSSWKLFSLCLDVDFNTSVYIFIAFALSQARANVDKLSKNPVEHFHETQTLITEIPDDSIRSVNNKNVLNNNSNNLNDEIINLCSDLLGKYFSELTPEAITNILSVDSGLLTTNESIVDFNHIDARRNISHALRVIKHHFLCEGL